MFIPTTYMGALLLAMLAMICWGSWANTTKLAGKWRFELFYFDYAIGLLLCAIAIAFTFGTLGSDITFMDNMSIVRRRQQGLAMAAGGVFNLANMLLVGAISVAGMAVAFPIGIGLALVIGVAWSYLLNAQGNPSLLFGGAGVIVLAILTTARAYQIVQSAKATPSVSDKSGRMRAQPRPSATKGIALSLVSGLLMGSFFPLVQMARRDEIEMGPYSIAFCFALAVFLTTPLYSLYFMNLPVQGQPVKLKRYFEGSWKQHAWGVVGGAIWCIGGVATFVAAATPKEVQVGPATSYALGHGATLVSTLWGLLYWKEFAGAPPKAKTYVYTALVLYVAGLAMVSMAPLFA